MLFRVLLSVSLKTILMFLLLAHCYRLVLDYPFSHHFIFAVEYNQPMSYQVLARKWRPQIFADVVGQQHVLTALANGLSLGRIHHAYLFSGTRGVGKTSIARLLAKALNCEQGVSATPCGVCDSCQQISQGRFVDLIEIDAASRTKVEDTRELLDNVQYAPVRGRYKVYLIDEVHMLSRHSFNALLKTLEEPPEHVKFLLATTDPQKLPVTILSRCLQFHLKMLDSEQIRAQLAHILQAETITFEPRALQLLARAADGSLRDALSLTDQAIASGGGQVSCLAVSSMLGNMEDSQGLLLVEALVQANSDQVLSLINDAASHGVEWDALLVEMSQLFHRIAMAQLSATRAGYENDILEQRIRELARTIPPADVQLYYQILLLGRKELNWAPERRMGVEMTLLRALAFHPETASACVQTNSASLPVVNMPPQPASALPESAPVATDNHHLPASTSQVLQARNQLQRIQQIQEQHQSTANTATINTGSVSEKLASGALRPVRTHATAPVPEQQLSPQPRPAQRAKQSSVQQSSIQQPAPVPATPEQQDYRWQAQYPGTDTSAPVATPAALRSALEYEKTPELAAKIAAEAIERDEWSAQVSQLNVPKLVQQMAMNCYKQQQGNQVCLYLRSTQRQLNTPAAQQALASALSELQGSTVELTVTEDDNPQQRTPQEWRNTIYAEKLANARAAITMDSNIQTLCQLFDAEVDDNSIRPV